VSILADKHFKKVTVVVKGRFYWSIYMIPV